MRRLVVALLGLALRVFYRRIEVGGIERVPPAPRPVIFVLNHPNALIDPLLVLCLAPRRVSFLAKAGLFRMPVVGMLARALDCLPVYRHEDAGEDTARNQETFAAARALLARGGTVAIFPEGTTHSEPSLKPVKTGAARIALSARGTVDALDIVPTGLYYTEKETFRSRALVQFGDPIPVDPVDLDRETGEPPRLAVQALSTHIDEALRAVTLNADAREALDLIGRAERIWSADMEAGGGASARTGPLAHELELRRRFQEGYAFYKAREPAVIAALDARLRRYEAALEAAGGLDPGRLRARYPAGDVLRFVLVRLLVFGVTAPLAVLGIALHYLPYRVTGAVARRLRPDDDVEVATVKLLGALLFYPLAWLLVALGAFFAAGGIAALVALALAPALGGIALRTLETLEGTLATARAFFSFVARPRLLAGLLAERRAIHEETLRLAAALDHARGTEGTRVP